MNISGASAVAGVLLVAAAALVIAATSLSPRRQEATRLYMAEPDQRERARPRRDPAPARRGTPSRAARPAATAAPAEEPPAPPSDTASSPTGPSAPPTDTRSLLGDAAAPRAAEPPEAVVAAYYRALDARRFAAAWRTLSPAVRASFGGFEAWRDGYGATISSRPQKLAVRRSSSEATVEHVLAAADRSPCGPVRRRFAVTWRLVETGGAWRAASLSAVERAGQPAACAARHDGPGGARAR